MCSVTAKPSTQQWKWFQPKKIFKTFSFILNNFFFDLALHIEASTYTRHSGPDKRCYWIWKIAKVYFFLIAAQLNRTKLKLYMENKFHYNSLFQFHKVYQPSDIAILFTFHYVYVAAARSIRKTQNKERKITKQANTAL